MKMIKEGDLSRLAPVAPQPFQVECKLCGAVVELEPGDLAKDPNPPMDFGGPNLIYTCPYCQMRNQLKELSVPKSLHPRT